MYKSVQIRRFDSDRRFGVELEMSEKVPKSVISQAIKSNSYFDSRVRRHGASIDNNFWEVKEDHSCGYEVSSFVGSGVDHLLHMANIANILKLIGCETNWSCGLHVHVEVLDHTNEDIAKLCAYWSKIEWLISKIIPKDRNLEYCKPLSKVFTNHLGSNYRNKYWEAKELYNKLLLNDPDEDGDMPRRRSINICNYVLNCSKRKPKKKTIEFRSAAGTLNPDEITNWARLCINFVEHVKTLPMPDLQIIRPLEEALSIMGLHHDENFYIFSPGLQKTRSWFLQKLLATASNKKNKIITRMLRESRRILKNIPADYTII